MVGYVSRYLLRPVAEGSGRRLWRVIKCNLRSTVSAHVRHLYLRMQMVPHIPRVTTSASMLGVK